MRSLDHSQALELQGSCIWLTGLSGSGKSTIARALAASLEPADINVAMIDGDILRQNQTRSLGYSKNDRNKNVLYAARLASTAVASGKIAIVALISPYSDARDEARNLIGTEKFTQVYVSTPLEICEQRDPKGLYSKARRDEIENFTGISSAYETPQNPDISIDTSVVPVELAVKSILAHCYE